MVKRLGILAFGALALAATARAEEWVFSFDNGDRVHAGLAAIRDGSVLVAIPSAPAAMTVRFAAISTAEPAPREVEEPRPDAQLLRLRDGAALLGWCRAIRQGKVEFETEALGTVTVQGRDVAELLPAEDALRATNAKFVRRFEHIEARLAGHGRSPAQSDLAEMDALWDEAKARERS